MSPARSGHREPAGVDRVDHHAGPRGRVGDPAQVVGALGPRPPPQEEPLGEQEHHLATGHRRQAPHGRLEHGQRGPRVARALVEDAPHPLPHHAWSRHHGADPVLGHELGHRELEGLVARRRELAEAVDLLGLVLADVRGAEAHSGAPVLQGDAIDGAHQRAAVAGQRLRHAPDAAGRHQGHLVPGPHLLQEESGRFAFRGSETARPQVEVVEHHDDRAPNRSRRGRRAGCGPRRGRGGRSSRGGRGPRGRADREVGDRLRAPVLQDLEVLAPQVAHGRPVRRRSRPRRSGRARPPQGMSAPARPARALRGRGARPRPGRRRGRAPTSGPAGLPASPVPPRIQHTPVSASSRSTRTGDGRLRRACCPCRRSRSS